MKTRHLLLPFLLLLPMLTACPKELINTGQGKDPAAILTGEVSYSEGVALPEGSILTVVLEDMSETDTTGTVIAEKKQEV
ncbi:MAG: YbaY family lipoprotein [Deltaproteobacteria bacterium]|nr:YbaY family lipoprotein [Deltaproteobacteria bacterium]MBW2112460.1 YbaY family lipoprotein [Deltaproteobacteria bacterium]MBW2354840.1 YbaY family lipoprotein [Deltaproteobacteria bacterium]